MLFTHFSLVWGFEFCHTLRCTNVIKLLSSLRGGGGGQSLICRKCQNLHTFFLGLPNVRHIIYFLFLYNLIILLLCYYVISGYYIIIISLYHHCIIIVSSLYHHCIIIISSLGCNPPTAEKIPGQGGQAGVSHV